jgi:hypothetical protein
MESIGSMRISCTESFFKNVAFTPDEIESNIFI